MSNNIRPFLSFYKDGYPFEKFGNIMFDLIKKAKLFHKSRRRWWYRLAVKLGIA